MGIDLELAKQISKFSEPNLCWRNAVCAIVLIPKKQLPKTFYAEGWLALEGLCPIEHGWLEVNGDVVDPTLYEHEHGADNYFAGVRYPAQEIIDLITKSRGRGVDMPLVWGSGRGGKKYRVGGFGGFDHPDYRQAYIDCQRRVYKDHPEVIEFLEKSLQS